MPKRFKSTLSDHNGGNWKNNPKKLGKHKSVTCELYDPKSGYFLGLWEGSEEQLFSDDPDCCPCPGGNSCLPGCCDLHDF